MKLALPLLIVTALGLEKGQYQTPLECVDVCPTNETNWRNNPTCKLEDLGVCKCVFEGKECIFYYNGGKWTQVCQDSKGKDPPLSNYCSNVCLESMPEYVNDTACNLEALMGCNYEYSNNSEYFFSCMDGKWKIGIPCWESFSVATKACHFPLAVHAREEVFRHRLQAYV